VEAERHYGRALAVLGMLPDTAPRAPQELALQLRLCGAQEFTHGFGSPEAAQAQARVRELSAQLGDTEQIMTLLLAFAVPISRGEPRAALPLAEELLAAARRDGSTLALSWGHFAVATSRFQLGDLGCAAEHAAEALRCYRQEDHREWPTEPGTLAHGVLAGIWAQQGLFGHAHAELGRLVALAERLESPSQRALAHNTAASGYSDLRDAEAVLTHAERLLALAVEHQLPPLIAWGHLYRGRGLALLGRTDEGIADLRAGIAGCATAGQRSGLGCQLGFLAEAYLVAGQVTDALATIDAALEAVPEQRIWIPGLLHLRGELRAAAGADAAAVEASFREAIALARELGTRLQELRATTRLARVLANHGRAAEARTLLAPLYASFTEGFDTRDLIEAKALLDELT
jgi:tetratricopeptide (TPR) repeat protein